MTVPTSAGPPDWNRCAHGAGSTDPDGCIGIRIPAQSRCLNHLDPNNQAAFLASLAPGDDVDLRGTSLDETLLAALLTAMTDPAAGHPRFGAARFDQTAFTGDGLFSGATFNGDASFAAATFNGDALFASATFSDDVSFASATFNGDALFNSATFNYGVWFNSATFGSRASFDSATFNDQASFASVTFNDLAKFHAATFTGNARFRSATFTGIAGFMSVTFAGGAFFDLATFNGSARFDFAAFNRYTRFRSATFNGGAWFDSATFGRYISFDSATFSGGARFVSTTFPGGTSFASATFNDDASFASATFEGLQHLGPLICLGALGFDQARFTGQQVTIEAVAASVSCRRAMFLGPVFLRLRHAHASLEGAVLGAPMSLQTQPAPFTFGDATLKEDAFAPAGSGPGVRLTHLEGVDAANLVLTDVDLSQCRFTGAFHLDQIQIGLGCAFAAVPTGWHRRGMILPLRWSRRKTLAEEHHWRALDAGVSGRGWIPTSAPTPEHTAGPDDLTGVYQKLRKAFEVAGDEPDAADFYYGEMEMRRNDPGRTRAERGLLWLYWLVSGYGLRASRALAWLAAAMVATVMVLLLVGLPDAAPVPQTAGTVAAGRVQLTTDTPDPTLDLPVAQRFTGARAQKATLVVVNSVIFRSSGQNLTVWGTVVEMLSRIGEPVLLGLAALAVRGRVKR